MSKAVIFMQKGFEEVEAFAVIDLLRRGNTDLTTCSATEENAVISSRGVEIKTDKVFSQIADQDFDMIILPGGPGTSNFKSNKALLDMLVKYNNEGKYLSAICAAPTILGGLGLLQNKTATCYPGYESELNAAKIVDNEAVITDGKITTSRSAGTALQFALRCLELLEGKDTAETVRKTIVYDY